MIAVVAYGGGDAHTMPGVGFHASRRVFVSAYVRSRRICFSLFGSRRVFVSSYFESRRAFFSLFWFSQILLELILGVAPFLQVCVGSRRVCVQLILGGAECSSACALVSRLGPDQTNVRILRILT